MAGAALSQSFPKDPIAWQARHFRKVNSRFRGSGSTFARSSTDLVTLSQGQVQVLWQAQRFRKVKYRFRDRGITFARSRTDFVAGAALSQVDRQNRKRDR